MGKLKALIILKKLEAIKLEKEKIENETRLILLDIHGDDPLSVEFEEDHGDLHLLIGGNTYQQSYAIELAKWILRTYEVV